VDIGGTNEVEQRRAAAQRRRLHSRWKFGGRFTPYRGRRGRRLSDVAVLGILYDLKLKHCTSKPEPEPVVFNDEVEHLVELLSGVGVVCHDMNNES
jgi:hypothetical protein